MNGNYFHFIPGPDKLPLDLIKQIGDGVDSNDIICISGCELGRDVHLMMEYLKLLNKRPKLYAFDTFGEDYSGSEYWEGHPETTPWGEPFGQWAARIGGPGRLVDQFVFHLNNSPAREYLTDWAQFPHWTVAEEFKDDSVSWVIANGSHQPKNIRRELDKWWPKMKKHGKIALYGHDKEDFKVKLETARQFFSDVGAYSLDVYDNYVIIKHQ